MACDQPDDIHGLFLHAGKIFVSVQQDEEWEPGRQF